MDFYDHASEVEELHRAWSVAAIRARAPHGVSASACMDCGGEIPLERRLAAPGCTRCFECQRVKELRR